MEKGLAGRQQRWSLQLAWKEVGGLTVTGLDQWPRAAGVQGAWAVANICPQPLKYPTLLMRLEEA